MITAKYKKKPEERSLHLEITGHANSAPYGQDLICSAASMVGAEAAGLIYKKYNEIPEEVEAYHVDMESGYFDVGIKMKSDEQYDIVCQNFIAIEIGLSLLSDNFPNNVQLITN